MNVAKLISEHIRLEIATGAMRDNDIPTHRRMKRLGEVIQAEHDREIARLKAQIGSRASALQTVGDTLSTQYGAPSARPVWKEVDRLTGMAELPNGVETTGD